MNILIIEDSPVYTALIKHTLNNINIPHTIVGEARDVTSAIAEIEQHSPNVLIMDIDLGIESSFDLFKKIDFTDYQIIFVTNYDAHAINAFNVEAVGYLLKPIVKEQLEKFLLIAQKNIQQKKVLMQIDTKLLSAVSAYLPNTISIPSEAGFDIINIDDIIRCEAINTATYIFLADGKKLVSSYNIGKFMDQLGSKGFYHVHRSHIINLKHIKKYLRSGLIIMSDDTEIPLSKTHRNDFIAIFSKIN